VNRITWLGHSTVLVDVDGVRVLTDPLLRNRVVLLRRTTPVGGTAADRIDAILLSHVHRDHLDLPSLRRLGRHIPIVAPRGAGGYLTRLGFSSVSEVAADEETRVGGLQIRATPAVHEARRGRLQAQSLGYLVQGSSRVYFAGDTAMFPEMAAIAGDLDLALLPVAGWGPTLGPGHLDPQQAAEALSLLRPRMAVPIHWGTLRPLHVSRNAAYLHDPPHEFARRARETARGTRVIVVTPGDSLDIDAP
jgi:L-ascorbate metabolism protein UlaG (beta-lactamase superfamily)